MAWGQPQQHRYTVLRGVLCAAAPSLPQTLRLWPHCLVALRRVAATPTARWRSRPSAMTELNPADTSGSVVVHYRHRDPPDPFASHWSQATAIALVATLTPAPYPMSN